MAERLLRLKFKELFSWHFMNADPHLGNFHYNDATGTIGLVDFGNCKHTDPADARFVAQQVRVAVRSTLPLPLTLSQALDLTLTPTLTLTLTLTQQFLDAADGDQAAFVESLCAQGLAENTLETLKLRVEHFEFMQLLARQPTSPYTSPYLTTSHYICLSPYISL